jgi:hypothetical protein
MSKKARKITSRAVALVFCLAFVVLTNIGVSNVISVNTQKLGVAAPTPAVPRPKAVAAPPPAVPRPKMVAAPTPAVPRP